MGGSFVFVAPVVALAEPIRTVRLLDEVAGPVAASFMVAGPGPSSLGSVSVMAFRGWPAEALEFFEGLEVDNSKAYWHDHRATYDAAVRAPMEELLAELAPEFGAGKLFRPYRDVRFSADKSPYKTHIGAVLGKGGYVQLSSGGLGSGLGYWHMAPDQLDRFRRAVADDGTGEPLAELTAAIRRKGIEITSIASLKTAPRGFPKDHPRIGLLRNKGLAAYRSWPVAPWLGTRAAKTRVVDFLRTARPLIDWLDDQVGPPR